MDRISMDIKPIGVIRSEHTDVDILDETPLIDIKPFFPKCDMAENVRGGWTENIDEQTAMIRGRKGYRGGGQPAGDEGERE